MSEKELLAQYKLNRNPFPPAATGIDTDEGLYIPASWGNRIDSHYDFLKTGGGPRAFPIIGAYGSGKTVLLRYLRKYFTNKKILSFYFDNPGVRFYDLANTLMRTIGRYEFAKGLWELSKPYLTKGTMRSLFPLSFSDWLSYLKTKDDRENKAQELQTVIKEKLRITQDDEIAHRMAFMVVETASKPYFEYRDFVAGGKSSLVAEKEEAPYFSAVIKTIQSIHDVREIAFLIDEFEEVAIPRRVPKARSLDYLATLRRLINVSEAERLWLVLSMTPEAADSTKRLDLALWQRFTRSDEYRLDLDPLEPNEATELLIWWLDRARPGREDRQKLFPLPDNLGNLLDRAELRYPRPLVRIGFATISRAMQGNLPAPFVSEFIKQVIEDLYPSRKDAE